ncbi:hypothetical protein [Crocosphaera sp. XPORK-15E]|uniref:hypothetical protein n=1 Tax=Crocosphaera sp. XPORK-15E TaxID=3110247 RepID=UPI002B1EB595|nr:hypothetical protein [Crocosphaera sp. XPORK-15E]MEA5536307.1 hypothetical protein [Crocosphaera sp. XPORK-15E]
MTNQKSTAKGELQYNTNRAIEFITEEVKPGIKIESDAVAALSEAPDFTLPTGAKPVLVIQIPNIPQRIIYYTRPAPNPWHGPNTIERWGPKFQNDGQYDNSEINTPETWEYSVLIDNIDNTATNPICASEWQISNADAINGFHACVDSQQKLVKLNLATTATNPVWHENLTYEVNTNAFARANMTQSITENSPSFKIIDKKLTIDKPANLKFEILGGDIACGAGGVTIPVATNLYVNGTQQTWNTNTPLSLPNQPAGSTFDVESIAGNGAVCSNYSMTVSTNNTNSSQVKVLVNGDAVPNITPFDNQSTIESFLQKYIEDGKIKLPDNQAIYLFEVGTTDQSSSAFDLQDNVVLATIDNAQ